ncbi:AsmA-like C-terminal region-containing protein [Flavobacterium tegetincola]|uniref:AsmA-like C-terminal region-containing protein n=1 Tax=Flavobacterium tegetincola TaxID=150172 RepID=UPI00041B9FB8|nr:AsmA-like C-terminal region-containing protein [Flavobacterium tegetincola]
MNQNKQSVLVRILKISGITFGVTLLLLILIPFVFADTITEKIKGLANDNLDGEISFAASDLSFFKHFPSLTLTLTDFNLKGSLPFKNQSLVAAQDISLGIDIMSLFFESQMNVDKIYINDAAFNIQVNEKGEANYNVYTSDGKAKSNTTENASLKLKRIQIENSTIIYNDLATKINIDASGFNYTGNGNLKKSNFDLQTKAVIENLNFSYNNDAYLTNKRISAELLTQVNTNSLSFIFEKNDLIINKLPVEFKGKLDILNNGYALDFNVKTENSNLHDVFTALPPKFIVWMNKTEIKGKTDGFLKLKGIYSASENRKPSIIMGLKVRDGFVAHNKSDSAAEKIYMDYETELPELDINKLKVTVDSLYFTVGKEYFSGNIKTQGIGKSIQINSKIKSKLDLEKLNRAIGIENLLMKGQMDLDLIVNGIYNANERKFPVTNGKFHLTNGMLKTTYYPKPIQNITLNATLENKKGTFEDVKLVIPKAGFKFEGEPFVINASFENFTDILYDVKAKGTINMSKIYKVFSQKGIDFDGYIKADLSLAGKQSDATNRRYGNLKNSGTLELKNIVTKSSYLQKPFTITEGLFTFNQDKMHFQNFNGVYGTATVKMNGYVENAINFILADDQTLHGNFSFTSDEVNINELMPTEVEKTNDPDPKKNTKTVSTVIEIPKNLDLNMRFNAAKVVYDDLIVKNLIGNIQIKNGGLTMQNGTLNIIGATAKMDAFYKNDGNRKANFNYKIVASEFDIKRAYNEIKLFREIVTAAEKAEGIVALDYKISGVLDNNLQPIMPSLVGGGILSVNNVKMKGFKLLNAVSQKTETDVFNNPDISKVDIKTSIKNNLVTIEPFTIKASLFRLRFSGQTSFDGKLNLQMRLGLPPLGIIGIPMKISGTHDNPDVKLGKKGKELKETKYKK